MKKGIVFVLPNGVKVIGKLYQTDDYTFFKIHEANRTVEKPRLKKMIKLMKRDGWLVGSIIVVDKYGVIIDGQSRFFAAQILGLTITFVQLGIVATAEIIRKNNTNRINWSLENTHNGLVAEGNEGHIELDKFMKAHPELHFTDIMMIAKTSTRSAYRRELENGEFKMRDPEKAEEWAQRIEAFKPYLEDYNSRSFVRTLTVLLENPLINFDELMMKVKKYPFMLRNFKQVERNLEMFEKIINRGKHKSHRIILRKL